VLTGNRLG